MLTPLLVSVLLSAAPAANQAPQPNPPQTSNQSQATNQQGEPLYAARCAMCHDAGVSRAPTRDALGRLSVDSIRQTLTIGSMSTQAVGLTPAQLDSLAQLLSRSTATIALAVSKLASSSTR